ncbi:MAG: amino acid--[acyl-carrier-protein] ligase [Methylocystis sp.]|uniref:amino acid--[acyl-carrier-protein] ligase n=1 Tax=Methylocystis sp. TaxID=1911079 RepID=UPI003DA5B524
MQTERKDKELVDKLFHRMGVAGVYARTRQYEDVVDALQSFVSRGRPAEAEVLRFPPVMSLRQLEKQGYLNSFPQLLGCVCCLHGDDGEIAAAASRADWTSETRAAELVLSPAACYPIYPLVSARGPVADSGLVFDVAADCFRHEPSEEIDRLQSFRMREFVVIGSPDQVAAFRDEWMERATEMASALQLPYEIDRASDPFFGRVGQLMAANQVEQALKFELLIPMRTNAGPTACMSFNYHRDHFGKTWSLVRASGDVAHSGCVAFGVDRLAVALFSTHGLEVSRWPSEVRDVLRLD